ncbi:MAG: GspH/FimT family pseudopilin [Gammaproteobacteria bacterium]|nr:GspH/FimT family pseudopilin [Gammaproteobacteria bacterium]
MKTQRGFTILELMLTLAIAAVVLAIGAPGLRTFIQNTRTATEMNDLITAINIARSEAAARSMSVSVVPLSANDWSDGWQVITDRDEDGVIDAVDVVVDVFGNGMTRSSTDFGSYITFRSTGEVLTPVLDDDFVITPDECTTQNPLRVIEIKRSGLIDMHTSACP